MFIFNYTIPERDGSLANDIIVHEYTHGITNRMTGGGTARYVKSRPARCRHSAYASCYAIAACRLWRLGG